jgi:hypothetical protein
MKETEIHLFREFIAGIRKAFPDLKEFKRDCYFENLVVNEEQIVNNIKNDAPWHTHVFMDHEQEKDLNITISEFRALVSQLNVELKEAKDYDVRELRKRQLFLMATLNKTQDDLKRTTAMLNA